MKQKITVFLLALASSVLAPITTLQAAPKYWNWSDGKWQPVTQFNKNFLFGAGHSHHQYEGIRLDNEDTDYNNWHLLEDSKIFDGKRHKNIKHKCGDTCKGWDKAVEDVDLVYDIGLDVYRMSVSWEKINPAPGVFDPFALEHYIDVLDRCNERGIKVLMGLHHYTDPVWFTELGGFTKRENIKYFVEFAHEVYKALGDRVWLWATFNSPSGYAAKCFLSGEMIAAVDSKNNFVCNTKDFAGHANMLCNLCLAHVEVYNALKQEFVTLHKKDICHNEPQVGILKNIIQMEAGDLFGNIGCTVTEHLLNDPMFEFFTTGVYPRYYFFNLAKNNNNPLATDTRAPLSLDFIGLNYYSHLEVKGMSKKNVDNEIATANPNYTIYPEGLYYALETIDKEIVTPIWNTYKKEVPIYVTENGIAAINDNGADRELFFNRYLYALHKAIDRGIDVRGYFTWSLMDNYEWGSYDKKYGLYRVDFDNSDRKRTLKTDAGTQYFLEIVKNTKNQRA